MAEKACLSPYVCSQEAVVRDESHDKSVKLR